MPDAGRVRKQISKLEGFDVRFQHKDGRNVRSDRSGFPKYGYRRMARNDMTVKQWKQQRFVQAYGDFNVVVLNAEGEEVSGQTKLGTVRASYADDER